MEYNGFLYYFKDTYEGKTGTPSYYCCTKYESPLCPGRIIVRNQKVRMSNDHTYLEKTTQLQLERDVTEGMQLYLHDNCLTSCASSAQLWELARKKMCEDFGVLGSLKMLPRSTGINLINRLCKEATGGDVFRSAIDKRNFVQFNMSIAMARSSQYRRTVAFGHPDLIRQMCLPGVTLFIDATFSVSPPAIYAGHHHHDVRQAPRLLCALFLRRRRLQGAMDVLDGVSVGKSGTRLEVRPRCCCQQL